jgi:hypothetical protein
VLDIDKRKLSKPLRDLVGEGLVTRVGEGKPYKPYRYLKDRETTLPRTLPLAGAELTSSTLPLPEGGQREIQSPPAARGAELPDGALVALEEASNDDAPASTNGHGAVVGAELAGMRSAPTNAIFGDES